MSLEVSDCPGAGVIENCEPQVDLGAVICTAESSLQPCVILLLCNGIFNRQSYLEIDLKA